MLAGVHCIRGNISLEEHNICMYKDAPCGIPPTILDLMYRPNLERAAQEVTFSPSTIQACQRQSVLQDTNEWYLDVDRAYYPTRGTLFHSGVETLAEATVPDGAVGMLREIRLHAPITTRYGVQKFSGKLDEVMLVSQDDTGVLHIRITDWKTKGDIPHAFTEAERKHIYQINFYAWLAVEILPSVLNAWLLGMPLPEGTKFKLQPSFILSPVVAVVVDEIAIVYVGSSKIRQFTSRGLGYTKGKIEGYVDETGHWHAYKPRRYEELELDVLHKMTHAVAGGHIRRGIEDQLHSKEVLPPPLIGEAAYDTCGFCSVRDVCIAIGKTRGEDTKVQEAIP